MKKIFFRFLLPAAGLTALGVNLVIGYCAYSAATSDQPDDSGYDSVYKLMYVIQKIRRDYVDEGKVAYPELMKGALKGMLRNLDPFCSYMDPAAHKEMVEETEGKEYGGVGIVVSYKNNQLKVIAPMEDSPGFRAGIKPGDVITRIDGVDTTTITQDECVKRLKGEPGTPVTITVYRESDDTTMEVTIKREKIEVSTVKGAKIIEDGIGYVRIIQFNMPTAAKLDEALAKLDKEKLRALVIDLRGNPGGLLSSAIEVVSRFVDTGALVVSTEGRQKSADVKYYAMRCDKHIEIPLAILVDEFSASASEIVAGCLKDHKRAVLIGSKTFGKGSVQTVFPLPDNAGAIRLTTAKYYTPSHVVIHENGIMPTVSVPLSKADTDTIYSQRLGYPGVIQPEIPNALRDVQLERAVEILKGVCIMKEKEG